MHKQKARYHMKTSSEIGSNELIEDSIPDSVLCTCSLFVNSKASRPTLHMYVKQAPFTLAQFARLIYTCKGRRNPTCHANNCTMQQASLQICTQLAILKQRKRNRFRLHLYILQVSLVYAHAAGTVNMYICTSCRSHL